MRLNVRVDKLSDLPLHEECWIIVREVYDAATAECHVRVYLVFDDEEEFSHTLAVLVARRTENYRGFQVLPYRTTTMVGVAVDQSPWVGLVNNPAKNSDNPVTAK